MIHENIELTGSFIVSGSFVLPSHPNTGSVTALTGSMYHDTTDNILKVYTGNAWKAVGEQTASAAGGPAGPPDIEYLVIAGGGGGGSYGGGGAGGYLSSSLSSIESGSSITVTVGAGGAGSGNSYSTEGAAGVDSSIASAAGTSFTTATSIGGGGGGDNLDGADDGGSGGGGSDGPTDNTGGTGTVGQGNDGGDGTYSDPHYMGGGGGGAGTAGADATTSAAGDGGNGLASTITGTSITRAGGGGGVRYNTSGTWGDGGTGGGGDGGTWNATTTAMSSNTAGTENTGGGGGAGKSGGKGVVILAYNSGSGNGAGGIVGAAGNGRKYHQFNSTGTFKLGNTTSDFLIHSTNLVMHIDAGNFDSRGTSTTGYDLTSYGNDINLSGQSGGSLTDNPWWNCDGTGGLADFDRNGVSMATDVSHTGYGNFTGQMTVGWCIDFWIKTTATGGWASGGKTIIGRNASDIYANITIYNNKANWNHYDGSWQNESSTTSINDGSWHHCAFNNHSDETIDIWVDGVKENDGAASGINSSSRRFKLDSLGRGYSAENTAMDLGQMRIYDATLTDAQILKNYEATKTNFV